MTLRVTLQSAYVLHQRPYRETSVIVDFFTKEFGRVAALAKGVRQSRSRNRHMLQPFIALSISWQGKSELKTLIDCELEKTPVPLLGDSLLSGFYLNELLMRLLHKEEAHPKLFAFYHDTLLQFQRGEFHEMALRFFEKKLLEDLGYGLQLQYDISDGQPIVEGCHYYFYPEQGFKRCDERDVSVSHFIFSGKSLLAIANESWSDLLVLKDAKRLMRLALASFLGHKPLASRKLFLSMEAEGKNE